jgi:hypothetical protein
MARMNTNKAVRRSVKIREIRGSSLRSVREESAQEDEIGTCSASGCWFVSALLVTRKYGHGSAWPVRDASNEQRGGAVAQPATIRAASGAMTTSPGRGAGERKAGWVFMDGGNGRERK